MDKNSQGANYQMAFFVPKSKKFWAFIGSSSSLFAYISYDRYQASSIYNETAAKCRELGKQPFIGDSLLSLQIVGTGKTEDDIKAKIQLFKRYCAKWLTLAGVDYSLRTVALENETFPEEPETKQINSTLPEGDIVALDSFTHSILVQRHSESHRLDSLGCNLSESFADRCIRLFNQRKLIHTLSSNIMNILDSYQHAK